MSARERAERIVRDARASARCARFSYETSGTIDAYERSITRARHALPLAEHDAVLCEILKIEGTHVVAFCAVCSKI